LIYLYTLPLVWFNVLKKENTFITDLQKGFVTIFLFSEEKKGKKI